MITVSGKCSSHFSLLFNCWGKGVQNDFIASHCALIVVGGRWKNDGIFINSMFAYLLKAFRRGFNRPCLTGIGIELGSNERGPGQTLFQSTLSGSILLILQKCQRINMWKALCLISRQRCLNSRMKTIERISIETLHASNQPY